MAPTETLAAIDAHRLRANQRRSELLAERRKLSVEALSGGAAAAAKVARIAGELRALDDTLDDLQATEQQARADLQREQDEANAGQRTELIHYVGLVLRARNGAARRLDALVEQLLATQAEYDALAQEAHAKAAQVGRPDTLMFQRPPAAGDLVFERLASIGALTPVHTSGYHIPRATIADRCQTLAWQTWRHLEERLPGHVAPEPGRVLEGVTAAPVAASAPTAPAAAVEEPEAPWSDDAPIEGDEEYDPWAACAI